MGRVSFLGLLVIITAAYFTVSKVVFDEVNENVHIVVDELFHLPQAQAFCNGNYSHWEEKITTLPGLYLLSSSLLSTRLPCTPYNLRFINLAASCINLLLFASILQYVYYGSNSNILLQALNLAILPPLYFFAHVYYTDTLALTFLLALFRFSFTNDYRVFILIFGATAMLIRQTNAIWIAMVLGHKLLDLFIRSSRVFGNEYISSLKLNKKSSIAYDVDTSKLKRYYNLTDLFYAVKFHLRTMFRAFFKFITYIDFLVLQVHGILVSTFMVFVYHNGGIVLGDKKAHEATIHLPQLLYFLLFYGVFGLPYVAAKMLSTVKLILNNKTKVILLALLFGAIVHFNTIVHPYMLADNRHFTFYIWQRWFGKYYFAKYVTIPVYIFLLFSLYDNLVDQNCISFLLPYSVCTFLALALQKMIEIRYFLVPYIILRLRFVKPAMWMVMFEFAWFLALNTAAFNVFFGKQVFWKDFNYAQRIIW